MSVLAKHERFPNPLIAGRVASIEALSRTKVRVSLDLTGLGAYWRRRVVIQDDLGENIVTQVNMPVERMGVIVEYVTMIDMMMNPKKYGGVYGWIAYPEDIVWVDEAGNEQVVSGMTSVPNRDMGCLSQKLCHVASSIEQLEDIIQKFGCTLTTEELQAALAALDDGSKTEIRLPLSEALSKELGDSVYVIDRDCEPHQRKLTVSAYNAPELMQAAANFGWVVEDSYPAKIEGQYTLVFSVPGCQNKCSGLTKLMHYPRVRIPNPNFEVREGQDDNSSTQLTRYFIASAAGLVAKLIDPGFPNKPGVYKSKGCKSEYPMFNERIPSCRSCIFRHFENRSNDAESRMGQSSIAVIKTAGVDPVYGCQLTGEWLDLVYQVQTEINEQNLEPDIAQPLLQDALDGSACDFYMWRIRYRKLRGMADDENEERYPQHTGVYRSWIPATRAVEFVETLDALVKKYGAGYTPENGVDYKSALKKWNPDIDWLNLEAGQEIVLYYDETTGEKQIHQIEADELPHFKARMPYVELTAPNELFGNDVFEKQRSFTLTKEEKAAVTAQ